MKPTLQGIAASDGIAIAKVYTLTEPDLSFSKVSVEDTENEISRLEKALEVSNKLVKVLEDNGAKVVSQEKLEKTEKIAFEVKGHNAAYWQIFKFESEPTIISEFERICRIDDNVIRYMVVKDEIKRVNKVKENKKAKKETKNVDTQEESKKEEN